MLAIAMLPLGCEKTGGNDNGNEQGGGEQGGKTSISVSGVAQKGQLIKGASVTAFGLDKNLTATGASYPTSIKDDMGSFSLSATGDAEYLEFRAEGYYFNENTGSVSEAPIYLQALAEKSETGVNINLLTTLTTARIKYLVKDGKSFYVAKKQAQEELLTSLNVNKEIAKVGFETMNIANGSEADAALLAVSILLQRGRSTGDLLAFIAEMSSEFESTGKLSEKTTSSIFTNTENFPVDAIVANLVAYYESKGITDYAIPPFYKFVDEQYAQDIVLFRNEIFPSEYLPEDGYTGQFKLLANIDFTCAADVDWIEVTATGISGNFYAINYELKPNSSSRREGNILIKDKSGNVKETILYKQESGLQRIYIRKGGGATKATSYGFEAGDKVSVNGVTYTLDETLTVEVEKAESYRIGYPESVTGLESDPYFCTVNFPSEYTEVDTESVTGGSIIIGGDDNTGSASSGTAIPFYGALKAHDGIEIPRQTEAYLDPAVAVLGFSASGYSSVSYMVVEGNQSAVLSGKASYLCNETVTGNDSSYQRHDSIITSGSNSVKVLNSNNDNTIYMMLMPQVLTYIKISFYGQDGFLFTREFDLESMGRTLDLKNGMMTKISVSKPN